MHFKGAADYNLDQQKAVAAARKAERDRDAAQARNDYRAEKRAIDENMMRLRTLRLAKESADQKQNWNSD